MASVIQFLLWAGVFCVLCLQQTVRGDEKCKFVNTECRPGIVLPMWEGSTTTGARIGKAFVYLLALLFFFLGVSIIADRFMSAIEIITSKEKEISIQDKHTGKERIVTVKIWNETVSNLTLMALGSSAPEILLSVIEICGNDFRAGDLGPSTIVGSAAFNLLVIIAICVHVIPDGEIRRIKHLRVFAVTASTSLFAYVWLYIIVSVSSPSVVDIWEAILTLLFFPALVISAYLVDKKIYFYRSLRKKKRKQVRGGLAVMQTGDFDVVGVQFKDGRGVDGLDGDYKTGAYDVENGLVDDEDLLHDLTEERREKAIQALKEIRHKYPNADRETVERLLEQENLKLQHKSRAFYRIEATRKMVGSGNVLKMKHDKLEKASSSLAEVKLEQLEEVEYEDPQVVKVQFDPIEYSIKENCGHVLMTITRTDGDLTDTVFVDFRTVDGTAKAGEDYDKTEGSVCFRPGETTKMLSVAIIDDDVFEEDEHFSVHLGNIRVAGADGDLVRNKYRGPGAKIGKKGGVATVIILDDDYPGNFGFDCTEVNVTETDGVAKLKVVRSTGARGIVRVPYHTTEGTAKGGGDDYEDAVGELEFQNDETWKFIEINIIDDEEYEKKENFFVSLGEPKCMRVDKDGIHCEVVYDPEKERMEELGKPKLTANTKVEVVIVESKEFKNTVDKLLAKANLALVVGTSSWREQFHDALTVSGSADNESGEVSTPSYGDYMMHYLTVFWKLLFSIIPPTDIWGGWACFWVSICMIGILTMFIGDIASHFGCTIGLSDSVVAITFVALGTSLPDTFASKVSAINDEYADSSIGNVTGSNSVNVFLGLGVAWSLAAIVHKARGKEFEVNGGPLGFSVLIFCICAIICFATMLLRRSKNVGGELGGPKNFKIATTTGLILLWVVYVILSSLQTYCHIKIDF